eukprot:1431895-Rhodomonas_salina.1
MDVVQPGTRVSQPDAPGDRQQTLVADDGQLVISLSTSKRVHCGLGSPPFPPPLKAFAAAAGVPSSIFLRLQAC